MKNQQNFVTNGASNSIRNKLYGLIACVLLAPLAAMAQPGSLDTEFDGDGKATVNFDDLFGTSTESEARAIAIATDGKIVTAGSTDDGSTQFLTVARQNPDGSLDTGFGFGGRTGLAAGVGAVSEARSVLILQNGDIVAGGFADSELVAGAFLVKFDSDGNLDSSNDETIVDPTFGIVDMQLDGAGNIIAALRSTSGAPATEAFVIARFLADLSLDTSFGTNGIAVLDLDLGSAQEYSQGLALQNGKIVVAGASAGDLAIIRLNADGSLDTSFGNGGSFTLPRSQIQDASDLTIQSDGKILLSGFEDSSASGFFTSLVVRTSPDGVLDNTFASGSGVFESDLFHPDNTASAIALQAGGKILISGNTLGSGGFDLDFSLARLNADGALDTGFGSGGKVSTDIGSSSFDGSLAMAVQVDEKIILAGFSDGDFALARYLGGGAPHKLRFYLHGDDVPQTAGGYTMDLNPPSSAPPLGLNLANGPSWYSEPALDGDFVSGDFVLQHSCAVGISLSTTYTLYRTALDGSNPQTIGSTTQPLAICGGSQTVNIPVNAAESFANQRLRLQISTLLGLSLSMAMEGDEWLETTDFVGTP